jgi:hypothetical protein
MLNHSHQDKYNLKNENKIMYLILTRQGCQKPIYVSNVVTTIIHFGHSEN